MITVLAFICVRIGLLFFDASLQMFLLVLAAETALVGLMSLIAYRFASGFRFHWIWDRSVAFGFLRRSWPILISGITAVIYVRLDVVMLTWWSSPAEAGIYSAAARLSEVWYFVPTLLMNEIGRASCRERVCRSV